MHCAARVGDGGGGGGLGGKALIPYSYRRTSTHERIYNTNNYFSRCRTSTFLTSKIPLQWGHLALSLRCPY